MRPLAFLLPLLGALLLACPPEHPVAPVDPVRDPDGGDYPDAEHPLEELPEDSPAALKSPCGLACENLKKVPCREGFPSRAGVSCYRGCVSQAAHQRLPTSCWASKKTPEDVRACGAIRCLPPL